MLKIARLLYVLVACVFPFLIGGAHLFVHFTDLLNPDIQELLQQEHIILGELQPLWNTWGIVSFMMGASFITIGWINTSIIMKTNANQPLPLMAIVAMVFYQVCVVYVGYTFDEPFQLYGGSFGLIMILSCLVLTLLGKSKSLAIPQENN